MDFAGNNRTTNGIIIPLSMGYFKLQFRKNLSYLFVVLILVFNIQSGFAVSSTWKLREFTGTDIKSRAFNIRDNVFAYSGYYRDTESGMYYLNARYYSPELMRFINRDSYNLSNRYAYCSGNPVSQTDPDGHMPGWAQLIIGTASALVAGPIIGPAIEMCAYAVFDRENIKSDAINVCIGTALGMGITFAGATGVQIGKKCISGCGRAAKIFPEAQIELTPALGGRPSNMCAQAQEIVESGERRGEGSYGTAFYYNDSVYKIYKTDDIPGRLTQAQVNAYRINALTCNINAEFGGKAVGSDYSILKMPYAETKGVTPEDVLYLEAGIRGDGRKWYDPKMNNCGRYKGKLVVFDTDLCLTKSEFGRLSSAMREKCEKAYNDFMGRLLRGVRAAPDSNAANPDKSIEMVSFNVNLSQSESI